LGRTTWKEPRFPVEKEAVARERIKQKLVERLDQIKGSAPSGLSGAASGGDILFLEICKELGIPTHLHLALPRDAFLRNFRRGWCITRSPSRAETSPSSHFGMAGDGPGGTEDVVRQVRSSRLAPSSSIQERSLVYEARTND
jgi:hypothetical protein